jgi:hypothetical protein
MLWPGAVDDPFKKRPFWDMKPTKAELEHKQHEDYNRREAELAQRKEGGGESKRE